MAISTPDDLWGALSDAAKRAAETTAGGGPGAAVPLAEPFGGALVVLVPDKSMLSERIMDAMAAADGSGVLPPYPPRCGNCRWRDAARAICRVEPPVVFAPLGTVWPEVAATDWCARWEAIP